MAKSKGKFDVEKEANMLVAKYVTSRTHLNQVWNNLYDFTEYCMKLAYKQGKADAKS